MRANRTIPCVCAHCGAEFFASDSWHAKHQKYCSPTCRGGAQRLDLVAAYWERTDVRGPDECWLWKGAINNWGYALFHVKPKIIVVHRWAYERFVGPIPAGMEIDHVETRGCRHRHCVNPAHLEPVTPKENQRRGRSPWFINSQKTHCIRGHEFTLNNTGRDVRGDRYCKQCRRERAKRKQARG